MTINTERRRFIVSCTALAAVPGFAQAQATAKDRKRAELISGITGGVRPVRARVVFDTPPLADNGHSVPVRIAVDSPMTPADHVRRIVILAELNPRPLVATYHLGPHSGRAEIATRMRVADIQEVLGLAETSDGRWWMGGARVVVTELACVEER